MARRETIARHRAAIKVPSKDMPIVASSDRGGSASGEVLLFCLGAIDVVAGYASRPIRSPVQPTITDHELHLHVPK